MMDIGSIGNLNSAYSRLAARQQEAEKAPAEGMEEQAAQNTRVPGAMPAGRSGGTSAAAQNGEEAQAKRDEAMLKQAAASASSTSAAVSATGDDDDDDSAYETIVAKADSGQTLTGSELSQLRAKDPSRYYKALRAAEARTALREQMEQSPSSAGKAMREAVASVRAQVESGDDEARGAHGTIDEKTASAMISALNDEYGAFSKKYDQVMF